MDLGYFNDETCRLEPMERVRRKYYPYFSGIDRRSWRPPPEAQPIGIPFSRRFRAA